jgi:hypothetical protein
MRVGEEWVRKDRAARPTCWAVGLLYWAAVGRRKEKRGLKNVFHFLK